MGLSQHKCPYPARAYTSAEITHLARKPIPYAFSRTLQVFKHFRIQFMAHFMTRIPRYVYPGIGVKDGERHQECEKDSSSSY